MKMLNSIIRSKWFIGAIGLLAFSLLIWFGLGFIRFGENNAEVSVFARLAIIGVAWLVWLTWNISELIINKRQNSQFLDELAASNSKEQGGATSANAEEFKNMAERFRSAMGVLKSSRFNSKKGRVNVYELPWYIIIGPPGAGKTTALINSGLDFPLAGSHGKQALSGVGGTRHCDWWFTNDAVLIDTAGRYTTQDSHQEVDSSAWGAFLQLLKKYRRRRPVNGVIVAVSLQDILLGSEAQREECAKKIRARIDELQKGLEIHFPIYFVFTKMDLLAGFNEYFTSFSQSEREQVWGVSFESNQGENVYNDEQFNAQFEHLVTTLNEQTLSRVHQERNIESRSLIQNFPSQFGSLQNTVSDFLKQCFSGHRFNIPPLLRGVYFTSATQEGSPIDRMAAKLGRDFNLEKKQPNLHAFNTGKSYFINKLFKDIIFSEAELVGVNKKFEQVIIWSRRAAFVALVTAFVGSLSIWIGGVAQNKLLISKVASSYNTYKVAQKGLEASETPVTLANTLPLLNPLLRSIREYNDSKQSLLGFLGLYDAQVGRTMQSVYEAELKSIFQAALTESVAQRLSALTAEDDGLFFTLKAYLMMFDDKHRDYEFLKQYFTEQWQEQFKNKQPLQQELLAHYNNLERIGFAPLSEIDTELVAAARNQLYQVPLVHRLYSQLKQQGDNAKLVNFYHEIGGSTVQIFGINEHNPIFKMPYLFTKQGYKKTKLDVNSAFIKNVKKDYWVYGDDYARAIDTEGFKDLSTDIEQLYLREYAERWDYFYRSFNLEAFPKSSLMVSRLKRLADPVNSPLLKITKLVADNTELNKAPKALKGAAGDSDLLSGAVDSLVTKNLVDKLFAPIHQIVEEIDEQPTKAQEYLSVITALAEFMTEIDSAPDANQAAFDVAKERFLGGATGPIQSLNGLSDTAPSQAKVWLQSISRYAWSDILERSKIYINNQWRYQVYDVYRQNINDRYPMQVTARSEVGIENFNDFFKNGGMYQIFYNEYLSSFVDDRKWQLRTIDGQALALSDNTLTQLKRAEMLRTAYFLNGDEFAVDVRIKADKLSSNVKLFNLEAGDARFSYSHGPRLERPMTWIAGSGRTRFVFEGIDGRVASEQFGGNWSFLRFYDAVDKPSAASSSSSSLGISKDGYSAQINVLSNVKVNPLYIGLLRNFKLEVSL